MYHMILNKYNDGEIAYEIREKNDIMYNVLVVYKCIIIVDSWKWLYRCLR